MKKIRQVLLFALSVIWGIFKHKSINREEFQ